MDKFEISKLFKEKGLSLGAVESFTGGGFAKEITSVPGASQFFKGSLVTYATEIKEHVLGVPKDEIEKYGVVSREVASHMVSNGKRLLNTDYTVSFTGNAGPEAMEGKPVGEVHIGIAYSYYVRVFSYNLTGSREEIQRKAIKIAFELLNAEILQNN